MKKYHAMIWPGVALVAAGVVRLLAPFSASIGTIHTACGNAIAYLDGQDNDPGFSTTISICAKSLRMAGYEGAGAVVVGLFLFVAGLIALRRAHRLRPAKQVPWANESHREMVASGNAIANRIDDRHAFNAGAASVANANAAAYEQMMRMSRTTRPRTVLSFFGVVFAALVAGSVVAISLLSKHSDLSNYIPWILVFDAIVTIMLIIGVFVTITKDPARLMLSEITNQNAVALPRGRRQADQAAEPITVRRVIDGEDRREGSQYGRRWDDPKP